MRVKEKRKYINEKREVMNKPKETRERKGRTIWGS